MTPAGKFTLVFAFDSTVGIPMSALVEAHDGILMEDDRVSIRPEHPAASFKINQDGTGFQVVHALPDTFPLAALFGGTLTVSKNGNIYGSVLGKRKIQ